MKRWIATILPTLCCIGAAHGADQLPRPTSHILLPYEGMQAELVQGVSGEPARTRPLVRHACLAAPDIIELTIDARAVISEPIQPWKRLPGDQIKLSSYPIDMRLAKAAGVDEWTTEEQRKSGKTKMFRTLVRDGKDTAFIIGPNADLIRPFQRVEGEALDETWADSPASYRVSSTDDPAFREPAPPAAVHRKTRPFDVNRFGAWPKAYGSRSQIYLKMPRPLTPGKRYTVRFEGASGGRPQGEVSFALDPRHLRSEAVHVNLVGYHPAQGRQRAFLYTWAGSGGGIEYPQGLPFEIVDAATGAVEWTSKATLLQPAEKPEYEDKKIGPRNANGCAVHALDFTEFRKPGIYRVAVPGIGCSFPFRIAGDVWKEAFWVQMKGYLHQRSGIELGPPYTTFKRPRCFHPADGKIVHLCDPKLYFAPQEEKEGANPFPRIQRSIQLDTSHPDAWGGWMDAGDFDRSIVPQRHYFAVQAMLDLYETAPAFFKNFKLHIPESDNAIPDIIDEALWCTELFRRVQQPDGGVPSSVESIEHPRIGEPSWLDSIPVALTPPMPEACYAWAATAAQMAWILADIAPKLSEQYRQSATRAIAWSDAHPDVPNLHIQSWMPPQFSKNLAAAAMLKLTGEARYNTIFVETFREIERSKKSTHRYIRNALFLYANRNAQPVDPEVRDACRRIILQNADQMVEMASRTALGIVRQPWASVEWGDHRCAVSSVSAGWIVDAHRLTGQPKYLNALIDAAQFGMGANPFNMTFTTGLGPRNVQPYHHDFGRIGEDIPDGISTPGPSYIKDELVKAIGKYMYPDIKTWPEIEGYAHVWFPPLNEHTVNVPMATQIMIWGHIAQALQTPQ